MFDSDLVLLLSNRAVEFLDGDDANPQVGMGMMVDTAINLAEESVYQEAARWNSMEALRIDFKYHRDTVRANVLARRMDRE